MADHLWRYLHGGVSYRLQAYGCISGAGCELGRLCAAHRGSGAAHPGPEPATLACAAAGASVCHVDASKGMVAWGRENAAASGLADKPVRWIVDDCAKFVAREIRRGVRYDGIIMDPPSYGRGPGGEVWKLEDSIYDFIDLCAGVLSDEPLFVAVNSYTTGLSPSVMEYIPGGEGTQPATRSACR